MTKYMKAIAVHPTKPNSLHLRNEPIPIINNDEVLVKVYQAGVCRTDIEINEGGYGEAPQGQDYLILGHESGGIVEEVGKKVTQFKKGDYVSRIVRRRCKNDECINCYNNESDMCSTGGFTESGIKQVHGTMVEYFKDKPKYLIEIPDDIRHLGILLEPLSVVEKALRQIYLIQNRLDAWDPKTALVIGAGPIGLLQAMLFIERGLNTYVIARSKPGNLKSQIVEQMGAHYISTQQKSLYNLKREIKNIDMIVEASGSYEMAAKSMEILGTNGILCWTSITDGKETLKMPISDINLNFTLENKAVFGTVNANSKDWDEALKSLQRFRETWPGLPERLITKTVPPEQFKQAFEKGSDVIKSVIKF